MQESERQDVLARLHRSLPRTRSMVAFALSCGVIALCALLKFLMDDWVGSPLPPFITFYPAVVIASLLGGPGIGLASAVATLGLAWYVWIPPSLSFALNDRFTATTVAIYVVTAPFIALIVGVARLSLDRTAVSEAERTAAARESVHRTKNLVAVAQALSAKIAREVNTVQDFNEVLRSRLHALSLAQNLLLQRDWQDAELEALLRTALAPFLPNPAMTVKSGDRVMVPARHVRGLCMALYELCTNAMKYGALAGGSGVATLSWHLAGNDCVLEWREEISVNRNARPQQEGFGATLIRMALSYDAGTIVQYHVNATSVVATFRWPDAARTQQLQTHDTPEPATLSEGTAPYVQPSQRGALDGAGPLATRM